jgi:hypothetical protein
MGAWSPQGGPFMLELGLGLGGVSPSGAMATIGDPNARFSLDDATGVGPQGSVGATVLGEVGRGVKLGATLRGTAMMFFGTDVSTTAWIGSAAVVLEL